MPRRGQTPNRTRRTTAEYSSALKAASDAYRLATNTKKAYSRCVRNIAHDNDNWAKALPDDFKYIGAITTPSIHTAEATLFRLEDIFLEHQSTSTLELHRAALKDYYTREHHLQGPWHADKETGRFQGNPIDYIPITELIKLSKKRDSQEERSAKRARPIRDADVKQMFDYLGSEAGLRAVGYTKALYFQTYSALAFTVWARNDELLHLQRKHVVTGKIKDGEDAYTSFELIRLKTTRDVNKSQFFEVPYDLKNPHSDCSTLMDKWISHLESISHKPLHQDDFLFPMFTLFGEPIPRSPSTKSAFNHLMEVVVEGCYGTKSVFTSHGWRRAGVQHKCSEVPGDERWPFAIAADWGGWVKGEKPGTMAKYVIDSVTRRESDYSSRLFEDKALRRRKEEQKSVNERLQNLETSLNGIADKLFLGGMQTHIDPEAGANALVQRLSEGLMKTIQESASWLKTPTPTLSENPYPSSQDPYCQVSASVTPPCDNLLHSSVSTDATANNTSASPLPSSRLSHQTIPLNLASDPLTINLPIPPNPSTRIIPTAKSIQDVVQFWENGDPARGLEPLCNWGSFTNCRHPTVMKHTNYKLMYHYFVQECQKDHSRLEEKHPGCKSLTQLMLSIRKRRIQLLKARF